GRDARSGRVQRRRDVRPRRSAGVQRARDGDRAHGPRRQDVGAQRLQPGARRAQPVRHRRRVHGELVLRESVADLHGPHRAGGGLVGGRVGPRGLMVAGILMGGIGLVGLGAIPTAAGFYFFYLFNALGNVCGGPLPNQVLLSRWFTVARGRAMGFAYLGIGIGGALVPFLAVWLERVVGWQGALQLLGALIILVALPLALVVRESPEQTSPTSRTSPNLPQPSVGTVFRAPAFYLLLAGSMCSIAAVGGTNQHLKLFLSLDHGFTQAAAARIAS